MRGRAARWGISLLIVALAGVALATFPRWGGKLFPRGRTDTTPSLAGQWRGPLHVGEGQTSELIVDLGIVGSDWAGQFDLPGFGVEDYPVEVTIEGRAVKLHLSAARIAFAGTLSPEGDALAGIASTDDSRDSLVLRRAGEPRFSVDFLALEKADDPMRLEPLSADGAELRSQFNADREYTRLVMLLSPS